MLLFLQSLHVAIINSVYSNVILQPKQVVCLEKLFLGLDVVAILPTGYGKSLIFHLLPLLLFAKKQLDAGISTQTLDLNNDMFSTVAIIVTPLNSLSTDQIKRLALIGFRASVFNVKRNETGTDDEFQ